MKVAVTGGAGYIGSHMTWLLRDACVEVLVIDDLSGGRRDAVPPDVALHVADVLDTARVQQILEAEQVTSIVHFAAKTVVPDSIRQPLTYYRTNAGGTLSVLQAAVHARVKHVILSSTAAVYGARNSVEPIAESAPAAPISPYGASKLVAEQILRDTASAHSLRYAILRYFNVAGADPAGRTGQSTADATHLIKVAAQAALGLRPPLTVYGSDYPTPDGTCIRDYIHVSDLVVAHYAALQHLANGGDNILANCGYGTGFSVFEVLEAVGKAAGMQVPYTIGPRRAGDPPAVVADSSRLRALLDWRPRYADLDTIAADALRWEAALHANADR